MKYKIITLLLIFSMFFCIPLNVFAVNEDYTSYTEIDTASNRIQLTGNNHIDFTARRDETTYLYKDYGVNYFTDFVHTLDVKAEFNQNFGFGYVWMLSNDLGNGYYLYSNSKDYIGITLYQYPSHLIKVEEIYGGSWYGNQLAVSANTWYYLRIEKSGTSLNVYVWSDSNDRDNNDIGAVSYISVISLTLHSDYSFRYIYACNSWNSAIGYYNIITIENLVISLDVYFYVDYYYNNGGLLNITLTNSLLINSSFTNSSTIKYLNNSYCYLFACPENNTAFINFTINSYEILDNPYNLTVDENKTVWCYFDSNISSGEIDYTGYIDEGIGLLIFVCAICVIAFIVIVIIDKKRK